MLEGEIRDINLIERLVELWNTQFTGAIRFENDGIIKILYFKSGDILSASTNDRADSIDEILMRAGKVSREHVKQALAKRKESETLGDALLNLGFITRKELTWARRIQAVGVIRSIDAWESGSFTVVADYLPKRDEGTLFPLPQILVELIVTDPDRQKFERLLDGGSAVYTRGPEFNDLFPRLGLNEDAEAIVALVDGRANAAEVAAGSGRDTFNVYRLLHALSVLGLLTRAAARPAAGAAAVAVPAYDDGAVLDAADVWDTPEPAADRQFDFDETAADQPMLDLGLPSDGPEDAPRPEPPAPAIEEPMAPEPLRMPAWDLAPRAAVPAPAPVPPAAEPDEERWGFDEAHIETSRRATASSPAFTAPAAAPKRHRRGALIALLLLVLVVAGAYAGWQYLQSRPDPVQEVRTAPPVTTPSAADTTFQPAPTVPSDTSPIVTDSATTDAAGAPTASATSAAPAAASATPAEPTGTAALPPVQPKGSERDRYDAMARDYAAHPEGNFTVQVQILCDPGNLTKLIREGGSEVWFVPQTLGARSCYRVFWGRYASREQAQSALEAIPASVRDRNSAVKPVPGR